MAASADRDPDRAPDQDADPDPGPGAGPAQVRLDAPWAGTAAACALALVLAWQAVLGADPAGRLLAAPAAVLALAYGVRDLVRRPVLQADEKGLRVLSGWRHIERGWSEVEGLRVRRDRRTPVLEVDVGQTLVVLSGRRLGRAPQDVLAALELLRR